MIDRGTLSRRDVLRTLLALAAECGLLAGGAADFAAADDRRLADWLAQFPELRRIGEIYLKQRPEERNRELLFENIFPRGTAAGEPAAEPSANEMFLRLVEDDYGQGRIVRITGWILSQTECRLCALLLLPA